MKMNLKKGFTLIELLVVVAIIAILSSIVMVSIGNARGKGSDASVKANLNTVRGLSEIFYANNRTSFLPYPGGVAIGVTSPCPAYNVGGTNMFARDIDINTAIVEAAKNGAGSTSSACYNAVSTWAVAVGLKTSTTAAWCIDATGASKKVTITASTPSTAINGTTGTCI